MPRAGAVPARWGVALLVVAVGPGMLVGCEREVNKAAVQTPPLAPPQGTWSILAQPAVLAELCRAAESEFDTTTSHRSTEYELPTGAKVTIFPHRESNQHSLADLAAGKLVAKFVNSADQAHEKLALPANGTSCLFVQSATEGGGVGLTARVISSNGEMHYSFRRFHIDFHPTMHETPLARWYSRFVRVDPRAVRVGSAGALPSLFRLAGFPAGVQGDSTGGGGPGAWVTCVTNGCCRVGDLL